MPRVNQHYQSLRPSYLFAEIRKRTAAFRAVASALGAFLGGGV